MLNASPSARERTDRATLLRVIYDVLWHAAVPFLPLRLWWRGRKEPGYRERIAERFGRYDIGAAPPVIWVHAVSLGETNAARPLVARMRSRFPDATILLTHMTATGRAAGKLIADARTLQAWLPYDVPAFTRAFLARFRPVAGVLLETELWPNLIESARAARVPLYLVNARLSRRSAARYMRIAPLARRAFHGLAGIAAQTEADAQRIAMFSAADPVVTGNLKFDVAVSPDALALGRSLRERFGATRPVWLFASSREREETLVLDAWRKLAHSDALLVIVPRHPQRFEEVAQLLARRGIAFVRRSDARPVTHDVQVVLGDSIGEMPAYCAAADVVLMGGSLLPLGGQNLIEPIAVGRPTVVGPHMFNFAEATASAIAAGAALAVHDADQAVHAVVSILDDAARRSDMQAAAIAFCDAHRGAADRLWTWLAPQIERAMGEITPRDGGSSPRDPCR